MTPEPNAVARQPKVWIDQATSDHEDAAERSAELHRGERTRAPFLRTSG